MSYETKLGGYTMQDGRFASLLVVNMAAAAGATASANGATIELGDRGTFRGALNVTAASGTSPTLDVTLQTSADGSTWRTLGTYAQKTGVASEQKSFPGCDRFVRATWAIGGTTPSFTFSIAGEAV